MRLLNLTFLPSLYAFKLPSWVCVCEQLPVYYFIDNVFDEIRLRTVDKPEIKVSIFYPRTCLQQTLFRFKLFKQNPYPYQ